VVAFKKNKISFKARSGGRDCGGRRGLRLLRGFLRGPLRLGLVQPGIVKQLGSLDSNEILSVIKMPLLAISHTPAGRMSWHSWQQKKSFLNVFHLSGHMYVHMFKSHNVGRIEWTRNGSTHNIMGQVR
jgi:hypothetical protein